MHALPRSARVRCLVCRAAAGCSDLCAIQSLVLHLHLSSRSPPSNPSSSPSLSHLNVPPAAPPPPTRHGPSLQSFAPLPRTSGCHRRPRCLRPPPPLSSQQSLHTLVHPSKLSKALRQMQPPPPSSCSPSLTPSDSTNYCPFPYFLLPHLLPQSPCNPNGTVAPHESPASRARTN